MDNKQCPTSGCDTEVQAQCLVSGDNYQNIWDCPSCAWRLEINTSEED